jgi:hypothetical protein
MKYLGEAMLELLKGNVLSYENGSNKWMATDSPECYRGNCDNSIQFENTWKDVDLTYNLNSQGYRCPEWDQIEWEESVVIYGDSCIAGVGVTENNTLSYFLQEELQRPVINLGVGGSSNLFSLYNMINTKTADITPYAVINVETSPERTLTFCKPGVANTGLNHWGSWNTDKLGYRRFWLKHEENYIEHSKFITENKRFLWKDTKYLCYELNGELHKARTLKLARDMLHPGAETYAAQAKYIKSDWIKNGWMD